MRILHMLKRDIKDIVLDIPEIEEQGFDAIQISPVQPFKNQYEKHEWYMLYQPLSFTIGNVYGSREDLIRLCKIAEKFNIKIIVDAVCNHTANLSENENLTPHTDVDERLKNNPYFWKEKKNLYGDDWHDRSKVTHYCMGLPALDTANYDLQNIIADFLNDLIDCGVSGFRIDAAKSIALPEERFANYPDCHFFRRVFQEKLKRNDLFNYGEVIFPDNDELVRSYQKYINVLTNYHIESLPDIVTFYESHDTYLDEGEMGWSKNLSDEQIIDGYRDVTKKFKNTLFYARPHNNTWKRKEIKEANYQNKEQKIKTY